MAGPGIPGEEAWVGWLGHISLEKISGLGGWRVFLEIRAGLDRFGRLFFEENFVWMSEALISREKNLARLGHVFLENKCGVYSWGAYFSRKNVFLDGWGAHSSRKRLGWMAGARIFREKGSSRGRGSFDESRKSAPNFHSRF